MRLSLGPSFLDVCCRSGRRKTTLAELPLAISSFHPLRKFAGALNPSSVFSLASVRRACMHSPTAYSRFSFRPAISVVLRILEYLVRFASVQLCLLCRSWGSQCRHLLLFFMAAVVDVQLEGPWRPDSSRFFIACT